MLRTAVPSIHQEGERAVWRAAVEGSTADELRFDVDAHWAGLFSERADAALVALLFPAMRAGADLHIGGTVTDELLRWVSEHLSALMLCAFPQAHRIRITADATAAPFETRAPGVAMGFSGGVDSFAALAQCHDDPAHPARLRVTHLLFNNVGSHGAEEPAASALFGRRLEGARRVAKAVGLPVVDVNSNVHLHYARPEFDGDEAFVHNHPFRNAAVAHVLARGVGHWYYASATPVSNTQVAPVARAAFASADAVTLPLLSTAHLTLVSANLGESRVEKTARIAPRPLARRHLDVCVDARNDSGRNCSACWKCLRTLVTLDVLGQVDNFGASFDLDIYRRHRIDHMIAITDSTAPLDREILELAEREGFVWPRDNAVRRARRGLARGAHRARRAMRSV